MRMVPAEGIDLESRFGLIFLHAMIHNLDDQGIVHESIDTKELTLRFHADCLFTVSLNNGRSWNYRGRTNFPICL